MAPHSYVQLYCPRCDTAGDYELKDFALPRRVTRADGKVDYVVAVRLLHRPCKGANWSIFAC